MKRHFIDLINTTIVPDLNKALAEWANNQPKAVFW
jgi:hypothetical protein